MFVLGSAITFTVTFKARSNADPSKVKYILVKPNKVTGSYATAIPTGWSSTADANVILSSITPDQIGLYKLMFYLDSDGTLGSADTLLGEYYFNVVADSTTGSFTIG